ncbi:MAG: rod shape-determining protein RodA [Coxiella sp. RIFCSPHIGHO2_12_FULL_44_14]|nr:MAG: rod shape-determining protein RodA [Coxiella sp. RIFCSPHIGHO2_12_FULL_44_14]
MNNPYDHLKYSYESRLKRKITQWKWRALHIDPPLLALLLLLTTMGLFILFSASNGDIAMVIKQSLRLLLAFIVMLIFAQIPPKRYYQWAPWVFALGILLLFSLILFGRIDKGAQRWLDLGLFNFQPSEIMKLAVPMLLARYLDDKQLPPSWTILIITCLLFIPPVLLTANQPDLGTAVLIAISGLAILLLAGLSWRLILSFCALGSLSMPIFWHFLHTYQKERVLTFLNPDRDPLGSGYHIIQSKIAIGSGGLFGKGWLEGTQSHLQFLPAHATDFIFAVNGEELGWLGCALLLAFFLGVFARCLFISSQAQDTFSRLLAGSLSLIFIISAFINIGMVAGILPVVGIPLPLVSYGGSSLVTTLAGFGIIMSIHTHRKLWSS